MIKVSARFTCASVRWFYDLEGKVSYYYMFCEGEKPSSNGFEVRDQSPHTYVVGKDYTLFLEESDDGKDTV